MQLTFERLLFTAISDSLRPLVAESATITCERDLLTQNVHVYVRSVRGHFFAYTLRDEYVRELHDADPGEWRPSARVLEGLIERAVAEPDMPWPTTPAQHTDAARVAALRKHPIVCGLAAAFESIFCQAYRRGHDSTVTSSCNAASSARASGEIVTTPT